jgi:hypothetical protein
MMTTMVVISASCGRAPIEEIARNSIREKATKALATYTRILQDTAPGSSDLVRQRLQQALPGVYAVAAPPGGRPTVNIYLRDHVTTSGGFWGQQRTVKACVRYSYDNQAATMKSIECPTTGPQSEYADEHVVIP